MAYANIKQGKDSRCKCNRNYNICSIQIFLYASMMNLVGKESMAKYQQFLWVKRSNKTCEIIIRPFYDIAASLSIGIF